MTAVYEASPIKRRPQMLSLTLEILKMNLSHATWRQVETAVIEFFRAEGGEILADSGESCLVVHDEKKISLSDLARNLMDPAS
jgi:hypothetical protein